MLLIICEDTDLTQARDPGFNFLTTYSVSSLHAKLRTKRESKMDFLAIDGSVFTIPAERLYVLGRDCPGRKQSAVRGSDLKKELHKTIFEGKLSGQYVEIFCGESTRLESDVVLSHEECLDKTCTYRCFLVDLPRVWTRHDSGVYMTADGEVRAWGELITARDCGGIRDLLRDDIREIYSTDTAHCAIRNSDGALFAWGEKSSGGDCSSVCSQLTGDVVAVYSSAAAFAAIRKSDGFLFAWGNSEYGGDCSAVADQLNGDIASIHSSFTGFVAIRKMVSDTVSALTFSFYIVSANWLRLLFVHSPCSYS